MLEMRVLGVAASEGVSSLCIKDRMVAVLRRDWRRPDFLTGSPIIDLSMPGMKMGKNKVKMKMIAKGVYQGTGIIVRCPSGKTIWQATINLSGIGSVNFIFDVIY